MSSSSRVRPVLSLEVCTRRRFSVAATAVVLAVVASACSPNGAMTSGGGGTTAAPGTNDESSTSGPQVSVTERPALGLEAPENVARAVVAAERGIRDASLSSDATEEWGRKQQRAYRALTTHTEWDATVRALIPGDLLAAFDLNVGARRAVIAEAAKYPAGPPSPTLPAWTIVAPRSVDELLGYYKEAQAATGVPWTYLAAINMVETRFGRIAGTSLAGAQGPMQFLPSTWHACCNGNILDPHDAIIGAALYLLSRGAPRDMKKALYGYNPNQGYVDAVDAYAQNMASDERALFGYHAWEVYVDSVAGTVRLPTGYANTKPIDAVSYVAAHPQDLAPVHD